MRVAFTPVLLGLLVVTAGCAATSTSDTPGSPSSPPTPSNWTSEAVPQLPAETVSRLTIGNESELGGGIAGHIYRIGNNHSEPRTVGMTVWRDATVVVNRSVTLRPRTTLQIDAYRPGAYTIVLRPRNGTRHVVDAPDAWDCNDRYVMVALLPDGGIAGTWLQTSAGC